MTRMLPRNTSIRKFIQGVSCVVAFTVVLADCSCNDDCPEGQSLCGDSCVDTDWSPSHCGECDSACGDGDFCVEGECTADGCPSPLTDCNGTCVNLDHDLGHCGDCAIMCGAGEYCVEGICHDECPSPLIDCSGTCTDTGHDPGHCGACDAACPTLANTTAVCADATCLYPCDDGYLDCDNNLVNGCEADVLTSTDTCGGCSPCLNDHGTTQCASGICDPTCEDGWDDCDGDLSNGCEMNVTGDASNCGACGFTCSGATPHCIGTQCSGDARSCEAILARDPAAVDGIYSLVTAMATGLVAYDAYCDMTTEDGGWVRVIGTDTEEHDFGQDASSIVTAYVTADATVGVARAFALFRDYSQVMLKKTSGDGPAGAYAAYDLVAPVQGRSILDILVQDCRTAPMVPGDDTAHDGVRVEGGWTSEYSGINYAGSLLMYNTSLHQFVYPTFFFMCGVNESDDNDQSVLAFADSTGEWNYWDDDWRGPGQHGTIWSFWSNDYHEMGPDAAHIGNGNSDGYAGCKLVDAYHAGAYEVYVR